MEKVFISYRRDDSADIAGRIYDRLADHFGRDAIFKDVDSIPLGVDFKKYLEGVVSQCVVELVVIGKTWLTAADDKGKRRLDNHPISCVLRLKLPSTGIFQSFPCWYKEQ